MTVPYKIDFSRIEWESPLAGMRHKCIDQGSQRVRLVEYSSELSPHWCEKGHCGYLMSGKMAIEYPDIEVTCNEGDGIIIPDGPEHRHKGRVVSDKALVFFIEKI
jgi:hypothetical protein